MVIVEGSHPSLLELDWFASLEIGITRVNHTEVAEINGLLQEFQDMLGQYTGTPISFVLDPQIAPIQLKP